MSLEDRGDEGSVLVALKRTAAGANRSPRKAEAQLTSLGTSWHVKPLERRRQL